MPNTSFANLEPKHFEVLMRSLSFSQLLRVGNTQEIYAEEGFSSIHIQGSPVEIQEKLEKLDQDGFFFCYSEDGELGAKVCQKLHELGKSKPTNLKGGVKAWLISKNLT
ncbi:MAG: rhodanese-like domain-containing protein [Bacteroidota bacterium]